MRTTFAAVLVAGLVSGGIYLHYLKSYPESHDVVLTFQLEDGAKRGWVLNLATHMDEATTTGKPTEWEDDITHGSSYHGDDELLNHPKGFYQWIKMRNEYTGETQIVLCHVQRRYLRPSLREHVMGWFE